MLQLGETLVAAQLFEPGVFQADIMLVIEIVDAHHVLPPLQLC